MPDFAALARTQADRFAAARQERKQAKAPAQVAPPVAPPEEPAHIAALRLALPVVQRAAAAAPTTPARLERQREASKALAAIRAALASATA